MMLAHPQIDRLFRFEDNLINTLVIEEPNFFRGFLRDIAEQQTGLSGKAVLSENNKVISFSKSSELIDSILCFKMNQKTLLNKIVSHLESDAVDETHYLQTTALLAELEQLVDELAFELPCSISCSKVNAGALLKAIGIEVNDDYDNDMERFLDYMEIVRELEGERLFIFVNLRSYYSDEDVNLLFDSVSAHGFKVLLVDSIAKPQLPLELRTTIDIDLCEF